MRFSLGKIYHLLITDADFVNWVKGTGIQYHLVVCLVVSTIGYLIATGSHAKSLSDFREPYSWASRQTDTRL